MKVTIDSMIRIQDVQTDVLRKIKQELTIKNPEYAKKKAIGLPVWGVPEIIKLYSERVINDQKEYILPRGYYARLWHVGRLLPETQSINDKRVKLNKVNFSSRIKLRDYQKPAVESAKMCHQGIILMPCGAGKTETALEIAAQLQQPALWITHTKDLLKQSMDRAKDRLQLKGSQVGLIQADNFRLGSHITFATVQTLAKRDLTEIIGHFGCVIVDEAHLVFKDYSKARMFESVISQLPAFYRFGITASEYRADGLIETMFRVIGPKIYEVTQEDLNKAGRVMVPNVQFIETGFDYTPEDGAMLNVRKMINEMRWDNNRNKIICDILSNMTNTDYCLALADSLDHLQMLKAYVDNLHKPAAFICGNTPKKERETIMTDMRAGRYRYLFATYQLAKLGLDIPRLNKLVLVTPKRDKTSIQQAVGRIMRPAEGKTQPIVYDIYDRKIKQCVFWARDRSRVYKKLGCEIIGGPKIRRF